MNRPNSKFVLLVLIINATVLCAQPIGTIQHANKKHSVTKAENGLIIVYGSGRSERDTGADRVDIFDEHGRPVTSLNVLRPVEGASSVSIYDVSARPGGPIAVAAEYVSKEGGREVVAGSLLLFDLNGRLSSAYAVPPSRDIRKLALDANSNIWTLTNNFEPTDPANVPMVVEYTAEDSVVRELLPHGALWSRAVPPKESPSTGIITMGYDSGVVWLWLPGSTDLVNISVSDGRLATGSQTHLPKREKYMVVPLDIAREPSGDIVGVFREDGEHGESEMAYYTWSHATMLWSRFKPGACVGERLIGVGESGQLYMRRDAAQDEICRFHGR